MVSSAIRPGSTLGDSSEGFTVAESLGTAAAARLEECLHNLIFFENRKNDFYVDAR